MGVLREYYTWLETDDKNVLGVFYKLKSIWVKKHIGTIMRAFGGWIEA